MRLYYIELCYDKLVVNVGGERFRGTAKRLLRRLQNDLCYTDSLLKSSIKYRKVSLKEWITAT